MKSTSGLDGWSERTSFNDCIRVDRILLEAAVVVEAVLISLGFFGSLTGVFFSGLVALLRLIVEVVVVWGDVLVFIAVDVFAVVVVREVDEVGVVRVSVTLGVKERRRNVYSVE